MTTNIAIVDAGFKAQAERCIKRSDFDAAEVAARSIANSLLCLATLRQIKSCRQLSTECLLMGGGAL
jgi:hypothetical protein